MDKFVGRETETAFLEQYYGREGSQILVVYGSRGVGKTRLLQEFCKEKEMSYYLAGSCSVREQQYRWGQELREQGAEISQYPTWQDLFVQNAKASGQKQVFVIDEFHHIVKSDESFFGALCSFVENRLLSRSVLVVLCTSASGWVENSMVDRIGTNVGRIAGFLKVRELGFQAIRKLFPTYSAEEAIRSFAVLGGIPGYWKSFSQNASADENIIHNIIAPESRLHEEMTVFLEQELREPAVYNTILATLARGCCKLNDIYKHTGFSRAKISVYLKILMELDLVEKVYSYETEGYSNTQKGIYRISNPYVRFYFRYLFPNQSRLQLMSPADFFEKKVRDSYSLFVDETYRRICREQMAAEFRMVGEWVGKTGSLDVVANGEGRVCVAACSYARKLTKEDYEWLLFSAKKAKIKPDEIRFYCEKGCDDFLKTLATEEKIKLLSITD